MAQSGRIKRVLDLFCGAGGASMGLAYAFPEAEIVGVDIVAQPRYPFTFFRGDAMKFRLADFDFIWASPPCQKNTKLRNIHLKRGYADKHQDWIAPTRRRLLKTKVPWVIENVVGAPLINPTMLCGSMFPKLRVYRHRLFETSYPVHQLAHHPHNDHTPAAGRGKSPKGFVVVCGTGGVIGVPYSYLCKAMGIDWMKKYELSQSIPPAFSQYIAEQWWA